MDLLLVSPFVAIGLFVTASVSDWLLTVHGAKVYKAGADKVIGLEGSYELNPLYAHDVDHLRPLPPRFVGILALWCLVVLAMWYLYVHLSWLPQAYTFFVGLILLGHGPIHLRHVRNIVAFRHANDLDGIDGNIRYTRRFSQQLSAVEFLSFSVLYAVLALLCGSVLLLGGALATSTLALRGWWGTRKTGPQPRLQ